MPPGPKLLIVVGARPQFIKAAALFRAIDRFNATSGPRRIAAELIHTGQHYDRAMSRVFFEEMDIPEPAVNLNVGSGPHGRMTARMLEGLEREILARTPSTVVTVGDTNSTLAGALAAAKLGVRTAHVEAGLRSFNRAMPEEINRIVADRVSDFLFCPSERAREQLSAEGITEGVHVVGDVMHDAMLHYRSHAIAPKRDAPFALATIHREENVEDAEKLSSILKALARSPLPVLMPLHPRTRERIAALGMDDVGRLEFSEPLSYLSMLGHLEACAFVVTDSGGLQKEAFYLGKKCVTARNETEWTELVDLGVNRLAGADPDSLLAAFDWAMEPSDVSAEPYGDGHAADEVIRVLSQA